MISKYSFTDCVSIWGKETKAHPATRVHLASATGGPDKFPFFAAYFYCGLYPPFSDFFIEIIYIFGTRPKAIKMAPVVLELGKYKEIESLVAVTAQHREILDQVLRIFDIRPDFYLNIMSEGQTLLDITSLTLLGLDKVLTVAKPNITLVQGHRTTNFASALAAYYHQIEVGHLEEGLRTQNKFSPYPEEMNRHLTG